MKIEVLADADAVAREAAAIIAAASTASPARCGLTFTCWRPTCAAMAAPTARQARTHIA